MRGVPRIHFRGLVIIKQRKVLEGAGPLIHVSVLPEAGDLGSPYISGLV